MSFLSDVKNAARRCLASADHATQTAAGLLSARGDAKSFGSFGLARDALGASVGVGFEAGVVFDPKAFYGEGHHYVVTGGLGSINVQTTPDGELNAISVCVGKSSGYGYFHFETNTEDTTGR